MANYFTEGWFESEHRNVDTGTIWTDWPGFGFNPGTTVIDGSILLDQPDFTILDNFESSTSLSYNLNSGASQTVSLSYDWSFRGDLSMLLEHDTGYDSRDFLDFSHYDFGGVPGPWITSVVYVDEWLDGMAVYPPQHPGYFYSLAESRIKYNADGPEFVVGIDAYYPDNVTITDKEVVEEVKNNPVVFHIKHDGQYLRSRFLRLSQASDDVFLNGTLDDFEYSFSSSVDYNQRYPRWGLKNAGGSGAYIDYMLKGVQA